jgi:AcrR family transcriptional regulator
MKEKKDLRYIRTNRMLCDAFTELLSKKKFESITVNELCDKAYIRRATFYTHFLDKYDFFAYFLKQIRQDFVQRWSRETVDGNSQKYGEERATKELNEFMRHMFRELIHYLSDHMNLVQNIMNSSAFPILIDTLSEEIRTSFLSVLSKANPCPLPDGVQPELAAAYYAGGIIQLIRYWIAYRQDFSEEELIVQYSALVEGFVEPLA